MRSWTLGTRRWASQSCSHEPTCNIQYVTIMAHRSGTVKCRGCLQVVDASILKQYIFQKGFITDAAKAKRDAEAQNATLQVCWVGEVSQMFSTSAGSHLYLELAVFCSSLKAFTQMFQGSVWSLAHIINLQS